MRRRTDLPAELSHLNGNIKRAQNFLFGVLKSSPDAINNHLVQVKDALDAAQDHLLLAQKEIYCSVLREIILANISVQESPDACWLWTGYPGTYGYGRIPAILGKRIQAHRASYIAFVGEIPEGKVLRHKCDTPGCVNPQHLIPGTQAENIADMWNRERGASGSKHGSKTKPNRFEHGTNHHNNTKLTEQQVWEIRLAGDNGESYAEIGRRHGIGSAYARQIALRIKWNKLPEKTQKVVA